MSDDIKLMPSFPRPRTRDTSSADNDRVLTEIAQRHGIATPNHPQPAPLPQPVPLASQSEPAYIAPYRKKKKAVPLSQPTVMSMRGPASVLNRFKAYCDLEGKVQWEVLDDLLDRAGVPKYADLVAVLQADSE